STELSSPVLTRRHPTSPLFPYTTLFRSVFHLAAIPSVPRSLEDPWRSHDANVNATMRLLEACRKAGVRRVVYSSSSSVYGDCVRSEEHTSELQSLRHLVCRLLLEKKKIQ